VRRSAPARSVTDHSRALVGGAIVSASIGAG
jgi:hypothetical protein